MYYVICIVLMVYTGVSSFAKVTMASVIDPSITTAHTERGITVMLRPYQDKRVRKKFHWYDRKNLYPVGMYVHNGSSDKIVLRMVSIAAPKGRHLRTMTKNLQNPGSVPGMIAGSLIFDHGTILHRQFMAMYHPHMHSALQQEESFHRTTLAPGESYYGVVHLEERRNRRPKKVENIEELALQLWFTRDGRALQQYPLLPLVSDQFPGERTVRLSVPELTSERRVLVRNWSPTQQVYERIAGALQDCMTAKRIPYEDKSAVDGKHTWAWVEYDQRGKVADSGIIQSGSHNTDKAFTQIVENWGECHLGASASRAPEDVRFRYRLLVGDQFSVPVERWGEVWRQDEQSITKGVEG